MPTPALSVEKMLEAVKAVEQHGSAYAAARALGIPANTFKSRLYKARQQGVEVAAPAIEMPSFVTYGDDQEPIDEILARKARHFERKARAHAARDWFKIKVNETKPYGVLAFGDPHLDDDGANIPLLQRHLKVAAMDGIYGVNIGDTSNNWVGRLERLYANQETSRNTGRRLVEWFMWDSGVNWLCWVMGNHDTWNEGADFHKRLAERHIPVIDWKAQFALTHPSKTECRIDASHGRKGTSMWNNLHATLKAAKLGEMADVYFTGHTHNYGCEDLEIAERKHSTWLVQLRGYKFFDNFSLVNGFAEHQRGSAVLTIVDPSKDARRVVPLCFEDVEEGAEYLTWKRSRS